MIRNPIVILLAPQLAGFIGSIFTAPAIATWYVTLQKPSFNPPNWLFAPAWLTLYLLMAIATIIVSKSKSKEKESAIKLFFLQLIPNSLWSILFFGLRSPILGLVCIVILLGMIVNLEIKFWKISKTAGLIFLPYILWVSFATALNFAIFRLN